MRTATRLVKWGLLCLVVGGISAATFLVIRHQPRVTIRGSLVVHKLVANGSRLVTSQLTSDKGLRGPLQIWNTRSGELACNLFGGVSIVELEWSPDGRHAAADLADQTLHIIDLQAGETWQIEEIRPFVDAWRQTKDLTFSSKGAWLNVHTREWQKTRVVSTARPTMLRTTEGSFDGFVGDEYLFTYICHHFGPGIMQLNSGRAVAEGWSMSGSLVGTSPDSSTFVCSSSRWDDADKDRKRPIAQTELWDSKVVLTPPPLELPANATQEQKYHYDWAAKWSHRAHFRRRLTIEHPANESAIDRTLYSRRRLFSPDSQHLASWMDNYPRVDPVEIFETQKGKRLAILHAINVSQAGFSTDSALFWLRQRDRISVLEVATGRLLWQAPRFGVVHFCGAANALVGRADELAPLQITDARTGRVRGSVSPDFKTPQQLADLAVVGKSFAIAGVKVRRQPPTSLESWLESWFPTVFGDSIPGVVVVDAASGQEDFRVLNYGEEPILSDDGSTLVTVDHDRAPTYVYVWDVGSRRAWTWAIAVGACAGLGTWLSAWGLRRWRQAAVSAAN